MRFNQQKEEYGREADSNRNVLDYGRGKSEQDQNDGGDL